MEENLEIVEIENKDNEESIYEKIKDVVSAILPENWEKLCLYSYVRDDNYEFFFYVKVGERYYQYIELEDEFDIALEEIRKVFDELYKILLPDFMEKAWNILTYVLSNDGTFNVEYDYDEIEDRIEYRKMWKEKYLK